MEAKKLVFFETFVRYGAYCFLQYLLFLQLQIKLSTVSNVSLLFHHIIVCGRFFRHEADFQEKGWFDGFSNHDRLLPLQFPLTKELLSSASIAHAYRECPKTQNRPPWIKNFRCEKFGHRGCNLFSRTFCSDFE